MLAFHEENFHNDKGIEVRSIWTQARACEVKKVHMSHGSPRRTLIYLGAGSCRTMDALFTTRSCRKQKNCAPRRGREVQD